MTDNNVETHGFQTEVTQLLELMIHSLYSNKEIFLRELISNASDAADKLRFAALKDDSLYESDPELTITIEYDAKLNTLSVIDNGIGMNREEVIEHLGTIAKSGTKQFFDSLTGDQQHDAQLIGQFGVGFYSAFIVADKVEVVTRKAGSGRAEGVKWVSEGKGEYQLETIDRPKRGTRVTLYLKEDEQEFLNGFRIREIIKKYSDHISLPINMAKEGEDEEGLEVVNSATALWTRSKQDISEEEYHEFYKQIAYDFQEPMAYTHNRVEGKTEYTTLLYIPKQAPFDLWDREQRQGIKLYVRRIFIMDDAKHLMPAYLRFVRGVIDSDDLPLNVSREILQQNKMIDSMRAGCTRKILDLLGQMAKNEPENYAEFWQQFGKVIKEGVIDEPDKREDIAKLFRFASTHTDTEDETVSLEDYVSRMAEQQKEIYFVSAESFATAKNSPHLEVFRKKGIEVLFMTDHVDEWVTTHLTEFDGKPLKSVTKGDIEFDQENESDTEKQGKDDEALTELCKLIQDHLKDEVKEVRISKRLTSSPACLVADENDMGLNLQRILKASGQDLPESKPILEVNPDHPIVMAIKDEQQEQHLNDWSRVLFDQALLSEGGQLQDPAGFVHRFNDLFMNVYNNN